MINHPVSSGLMIFFKKNDKEILQDIIVLALVSKEPQNQNSDDLCTPVS